MCRGVMVPRRDLAVDPSAGWEAGCSARQGLGGGSRNRGESGGGRREMAGSMLGIVGSGEGRRGTWRGKWTVEGKEVVVRQSGSGGGGGEKAAL